MHPHTLNGVVGRSASISVGWSSAACNACERCSPGVRNALQCGEGAQLCATTAQGVAACPERATQACLMNS